MEPQNIKENKTVEVENKDKFDVASLDFENKQMDKKFLIIGVLLLLIAGTVSGYFLAKEVKSTSVSINSDGSKIVKSEKVIGSMDEKAFPDTAEGVLEEGGIDGEGTHKLIREGGQDKTAYLMSSLINLDDYVGKKVKIWGETFAAQKAGWLMDVGRLEIME